MANSFDSLDSQNMDNFTSCTPQVLAECVEKLESPANHSYIGSSPTSQRFSNHPSIQYFQKVKAKNHYKYHKSKMNKYTVDSIKPKENSFDPYNRDGLLSRLRSFNALNWRVPESAGITELKCSQNGWRCVSYSNTNAKNHLVCTSCNSLLILKFNENNEYNESMHLPFEFDAKDYDELNKNLGNQYLKQITRNNHNSNCPWREYEVPLEGVYYLRAYLSTTDEYLINEYLSTLKTLTENREVLILHRSIFNESALMIEEQGIFNEFVRISHSLLVEKYYKDNKENSTFLMNIPLYVYNLAIFGWNLKVQTFSNRKTLLFNCSNCNARFFINPSEFEPTHDSENDLNLSSSKILTPCKYPITINTMKNSFYEAADFEFDNDTYFDILEEHKSWCFFVNGFDKEKYLNYFFSAIIQTDETQTKLIDNYDMIIDSDESLNKRRGSFDIKDGLDRLRKLRKVYLLDE